MMVCIEQSFRRVAVTYEIRKCVCVQLMWCKHFLYAHTLVQCKHVYITYNFNGKEGSQCTYWDWLFMDDIRLHCPKREHIKTMLRYLQVWLTSLGIQQGSMWTPRLCQRPQCGRSVPASCQCGGRLPTENALCLLCTNPYNHAMRMRWNMHLLRHHLGLSDFLLWGNGVVKKW